MRFSLSSLHHTCQLVDLHPQAERASDVDAVILEIVIAEDKGDVLAGDFQTAGCQGILFSFLQPTILIDQFRAAGIVLYISLGFLQSALVVQVRKVDLDRLACPTSNAQATITLSGRLAGGCLDSPY